MRTTCALLLAVLTVAVVPAQEPVPDLAKRGAPGDDWPRFLGTQGDGKSTEGPLPLPWPKGGPRLVWHVTAGDGYGAPVISRGRLFFFDREGDRARLRCLHAETGRELWRAEYATAYEDMYGYSNGPRAMPVVDDDRVYVFGVEGRLRCHRVVDGELLWEVDTTNHFGVQQNFFGVGSTPVVEGPLLIVPVGGSPPESPDVRSGEVRGNGSGIVAFDKLTGEVRYRVTDELASYSSPQLATIGKRRWGFVFARGGLVGFEPSTGKVDFQFPWRASKIESVNAATPVVVDDTVFITEGYGPGAALLRVKPGGHAVVWQDPRRGKSLASHWATPIHHEGTLYGCSGQGSGDAELRAVEHATGKVLWSEPGLGRVTLMWVDGHLVVLTERGRLLLVRATPAAYQVAADVTPRLPRAGDEAGEPLLEFPVWNAPVLSRGLLYLRSRDRLACLELIPVARSAD